MSAAASSPSVVRVALCQMLVGADKAANLRAAAAAVAEAATNKAAIVALPECFNSPYATDQFPVYAEEIPDRAADVDAAKSPSVASLCAAAAEHKVYLVGGSIPERAADGKIYNTSVVCSPEGEIIARHRKMHLFDIDIPGKITFRESDTLSPGQALTTFDTPYGKCGLGICYDIRFPHLAMLLRDAGCSMLFYPGAFNMTTGPAHWELLQRARALDTQSYVATISPARNPGPGYQAWGHSSAISPWGEVLATTDEKPGIVYSEWDLGRVGEIRAQIPVSKQWRGDLYALEWKGAQ